jgi:hypothetical protein
MIGEIKVPKWFMVLWKHYVGLDPYRCYMTDEHPQIVGPSKVIRVSMTVDVEVPEAFDTSKTYLGIVRSVVGEDFDICEPAHIQTWNIERTETIKPAKPRRSWCKVCGMPWPLKDCQQI